MNNVNWGSIGDHVDVMPPGTTAGEGRCEAQEWGVRVEDVVVYSSLAGLRDWATSVLETLPPERDSAPLVVVDHDRQRRWLAWSGVLNKITTGEPSDTVTLVRDLVRAVATDPAAAGWTLGDDVARVWADFDDSGDLVAGVRLAGTGHDVGIGEPMSGSDFKSRFLATPAEQADACLLLIADRINTAY